MSHMTGRPDFPSNSDHKSNDSCTWTCIFCTYLHTGPERCYLQCAMCQNTRPKPGGAHVIREKGIGKSDPSGDTDSVIVDAFWLKANAEIGDRKPTHDGQDDVRVSDLATATTANTLQGGADNEPCDAASSNDCNGQAVPQKTNVNTLAAPSHEVGEVASPDKSWDVSSGKRTFSPDEQSDNARYEKSPKRAREAIQPSSLVDLKCLAIKNPDIPGLFLIKDFISEQEELALTQELDSGSVPPSWTISHFNGVCFGMKWGVVTDLRSTVRTVRAHDPVKGEVDIPVGSCSVLGRIVDRITASDFGRLAKLPRRIDGRPSWVPNECNANDYYKSQGHDLKAHFDDRKLSGAILATLSFNGGAIMTFVHGTKHYEVRVPLPRRSIQVVTREARYNWKHSIKNCNLLDDRRTSITFRMSKITVK